MVKISENGEPELVKAEDTETPLADLDLDHLCNIVYFILVFAIMLEGIFYSVNMKGHQAKIHSLKERKRNRTVR